MAGESNAGRRNALLAILMWVGLLLCVLALVRSWPEFRKLSRDVGGGAATILVLALLSAWGAAVAGWRAVIQAYGADRVPWSVASRHVALLLLGKYIPGGIWGFSARLADSSRERSLPSMFAAGVAEQWFGLVSLASFSLLGLLASRGQQPVWLAMALLIPLVSVTTLVLVHWSIRRTVAWLPASLARVAGEGGVIRAASLWGAAWLALLQQAFILALVGCVAVAVFALNPMSALALAGSYGLAISAGIIAVFAPGGILVREVVFVALSSPWLPKEQAIALAAGLRLMFTALDLLAGAVAIGLNLGRRSGA